MAKYSDPKCRLCRREGSKLFLKSERCNSPKCPIDKKGPIPPGQHGQKRRRRISEYGTQLREKQKAKRIYGILEKQFSRYFKKAIRAKGETGWVLLRLLELRLDNIVYRLGLAPSRSVARQLVSHGHILVDNKKVNLPSYSVKPEQIISLSPKALKMEALKKRLSQKEPKMPDWLKRKAAVGTIARLPEKEELETEINANLIVEFYSR